MNINLQHMCTSCAEKAKEKLSLCPRFYKLHKVNKQTAFFKYINTNCDNGKSIIHTLFLGVTSAKTAGDKVFSRMCLLFIKMTQRKRDRKRVWKRKERVCYWWNKQEGYFHVMVDSLSSGAQLNMCFVSWLSETRSVLSQASACNTIFPKQPNKVCLYLCQTCMVGLGGTCTHSDSLK